MRRPRRSPEAAAQRPPAPADARAKGTGRRAHAGPPAEESADREGRAPFPVIPGGGSGKGGRAGGGTRLRLRPATVRAKIVSLLMVPVVSLLALWGFATVDAAQDIGRLSRAQQVDRELRAPVAAAVTELQAERRAAVRLLADPTAGQAATAQAPGQPGALDQQASRTDTAVRALRLGDRNTVADSGDYRTDIVVRLRAFVAAAEALGPARKDIAEHRATLDAAYETYTGLIDSALEVCGALSGGGRDAELGSDARVLLEFARAGEQLSREDALLTVPGPRSAETTRRLTGAVETRRALTDAAARDLPEAQQGAWQSVARSAVYADLTGAEDQALAAPAGGAAKDTSAKDPAAKDTRAGAASGAAAATVPVGWEAAYTSVSASMREIGNAAHAASADRGDPVGAGVVSPAGIAVVLGLAAVAASLVISVRIGRALVVELVSLRNTALEIAHRKLPHAMDRLRAGQDIDVAAETPPGPAAEDEIAQVGEALATVHRAALSAAVERAELASGVSGVFVNLARRSQVLVHKQLTLLDSMERRADDPNELGDLFRLDHLTTRMRRHAESLIILSGAAPGRAWRMPIPLTNVVRAAVSEIEDYPRVEVRQLAEAAVIGGAVADLTHLLAELIENATQFSPPHTKVRVSGEPVGAGYVLEVEDRGLGMGREALQEANRRIEQSEALDLFDSDRLGLFVVSRLSARHGVKVHLRMSPYGGTTAVVLLPNSLLQGALTAAPPVGDRPRERRPASEPAPEQALERVPEPSPAMSVVRDDVRGIPVPDRSPLREEPLPAPVAPIRPLGSGGAGPRTPAPAVAAASPTASVARAASPAPAGATVTELPRRVRQASLVPQLREAPAAKAPAPARGTEDPPGRSPEQARDRMAAYRAGWVRGTRASTGAGIHENSPHAGSEGEGEGAR
ncbi:nitrate- and nitrite sensing domain-containing protein [Streptomyces sp. NBC_00503]|uniref:nitrate- and nitrite sensing domain-containing protein n=1 Tax=Streptomyces sp. NBC_00503 TaxID=2903659 RepID=UPI002E8010C8|nr:nitrate- and nitrite sensing domain-containing protein [Streptomyces sp. NBC_00503]WUD80026.1 nitrate- and nitrite sensing domain-containing protein [Streptomyces sp. NBC_00503]